MATNLDKNQTLVRWLNLVPYFRNKPNASIFEAAQDLNMDAKEVKSALDALTTTGVGSYTEEMLDLIEARSTGRVKAEIAGCVYKPL